MLTPTRPGADDGVFNLQGYHTFGLVCALSIGLFSTITATGTHKRIPYLATASTTDDEATTSDQRRSVLSTARLILSSNSLTSLLACALFSAIGEGLGKTLDMIVLQRSSTGVSLTASFFFFAARRSLVPHTPSLPPPLPISRT